MKINETCTCGAKCEVEMASPSAAALYIKSWRREHTHHSAPYSLPKYPSVTYGSPMTANGSGVVNMS